jgi:xylulokinase
MAAIIGIDIGTSAVKAVMLDTDGTRLVVHASPYPTTRPAPGWVEQDAGDWMAPVMAALSVFAGHPRAGQVAAIGVTSQVNTHLFVDARLTPLRPAIVWQDTRAAAQGAALEGAITPEARIAALGAPIPLDASHALSRMAWVARHEPDIWARCAHVLLPKDHAIAHLTGAVGADPISAVGLAGPDLAYAGAILDLVPGAAGRLPPLQDPRDLAGRVTPAALGGAFAGVPVVRGTMDAWASMFGIGVAEAGQGMLVSGTSEVLGLISPLRVPVAGVVSFPDWAGITLHAGPTQAGGGSLAWLAGVLGRTPAELTAELGAGQHAITATSPLFLPHLQGERAPLWDAGARGAFVGLDPSADQGALALAVMEGVAFSARLALEAVEAAGGGPAREIRCGGGGTVSDLWCQIRADALGRPLTRMRAPDAGAVGAGVIAGAGAGLMDGLAEAARALVRPDRVFHPDPAAAARAARRFALYRPLYEALRPVHAALSRVPADG